MTVIGCVSAAGHAISPFVILIDHFAKYAVGARPLLLLLDGHSSHYTPDMILHAKEHGIIIFCLPSHTIHEYQPLDVAVFGPLKRNWQEACHNYMHKNPGKVVTRYNFSSLLSEAWSKTMIPSTLASGFRKCGVYPFNPEAPQLSRKQKVTTEKEQKPQLTTTSKPSGTSEKEQQDSQPPIAPSATAVPYTSPTNMSEPTVPQLTAEEEAHFELRFEEGFDLYDPRFIAWLECNHPEGVPADRYSLISALSHSQDGHETPSLLLHFSSVDPADALQFQMKLHPHLRFLPPSEMICQDL